MRLKRTFEIRDKYKRVFENNHAANNYITNVVIKIVNKKGDIYVKEYLRHCAFALFTLISINKIIRDWILILP